MTKPRNLVHRSAAVLILLLGLLVPLVVGGTTTSALAVGCNGNGCTGLNPVSMGCSGDARTIDSYRSGSMTVNLRESPACFAVWAQIVGTGSSSYGGAILGYTSTSNPYPSVEYIATPPSPQGSYSLMVSFHYWTKACLAFNASGWGTQGCTGFH
jgi:Protein of unknown function (DUF2690)